MESIKNLLQYLWNIIRNFYKIKNNGIVISWYNIANAANDELSSNYRYSQRESEIIKTIKYSQSDIVNIAELRLCSDLSGKRQRWPDEIAYTLAKRLNMNVGFLRPQNVSEYSFWRTTLFNSKKVKHIKNKYAYAIQPKNGCKAESDRGVMLMFSQFCHNNKLFWVVNSHMPINTQLKLETILWLNKNAEKICTDSDDIPLIFYGGDQNTFFDKPDDGCQMMELFSKKWTHLSGDIKTTFKSFPHNKIQTESILDHIFVNTAATHKFKMVTKQKAIDKVEKVASDHYLLCINIELL